MNDLKVGDLAYVGLDRNRLGVITKFIRGRNHKGYARYYATVFVFKSAGKPLIVSADRLTKAKDEGV